LQYNRNLLLGMGLGVDGLKTGHTDDSGYGVTISAKDAATSRRVFVVVNGLNSMEERKKSAEILVRYGLNHFTNIALTDTLAPQMKLPVAYGAKSDVTVATEKPLIFTVPKVHADDLEVSIRYQSPLKAPIAKGTQVGMLRVKVGNDIQRRPVFTSEDVAEAGIMARAVQNLGYVFKLKQ
jgi:D-alanyl-D-alanine carboxypeptidase (penicillin-binding protein 5/6)